MPVLSGFCSGPCQLCQPGPGAGHCGRFREGGARMAEAQKRDARKSKCQKQNGGRHCCRPPLSPLLARLLSIACANAHLAAVPCPLDPSSRTGILRSALPFRSVLQAGASCSAQPSVMRRLLVRAAWAWQSLVPLPPAARCRASGCCGRVSFLAPSGSAPLGAALARLAFGRTVPPVEKGPFRTFWRAAPRAASAGSCPRSSDHRPCRIRLASGRHSGIRNRSFRSAIRPFQSAHQHAGTGFNANFSAQSDQKISAFISVPCGLLFTLHFPLGRTDAAPRS